MMDYYYSKKWPKNHQDFLSFFFSSSYLAVGVIQVLEIT